MQGTSEIFGEHNCLCFMGRTKCCWQEAISKLCVMWCICFMQQLKGWHLLADGFPHYGGGGLVIQSCLALVTPWTTAHQSPLFMGFPRQGTGVYCHFLFPGDLPDLGIELMSLTSSAMTGRFFITRATGKTQTSCSGICLVYLGLIFFSLLNPFSYSVF